MADSFRILFTQTAESMLHDIADRRVRAMVVRRVEKLAQDPEGQGKPLVEDLAGFRSLAGARHRVIYTVREGDVIVVAVGIRREGDRQDAYARAKRLLELRLLDLPRPAKKPPKKRK